MTQEIFALDCRELAPLVAARTFDVLLTDPPYSAHTHANAVSCAANSPGGMGARKREFGFASLDDSLRTFVARCASLVRRWSVVCSDVESAQDFARACEAQGAEYVRTLPWVRWSMAQLSSDRPPQGWEALVLAHAPREKGQRMRWGGPGGFMAFRSKCLRGSGKHPAEKPLDLALDLVSFFSEPGETVLDLFAGAGTFGLACQLLGRGYVGAELDQAWAERAQQRLSSPLIDRDLVRVDRWIRRTTNRMAKTEALPEKKRSKQDLRYLENARRDLARLGVVG